MGQCVLILMIILAIVVEILIFLKNVHENIQCVHGYSYSSGRHKICILVHWDSWEIMKNCFPDAKPIKKSPKTVLCKKCTYVQNNINENDEKIDSTEDNKPTFLSYYFLENQFLLWKLLKKG